MKRHSGKRALRRILCIAIAVLIVIPAAMTVIIYESAFGTRYETASWMEFSAKDFEGLHMERSDFLSDGVMLAGYKYSKDGAEATGVVIVAHGLGGGGQNQYMPIVDFFASNGYAVFAYDARGNDNSQGDSVRGLPQGVIDLDSAICHVESLDEYENLPIMLFGHSWGAYSSGCALALHPEIKAAALLSGCNESEDLLRYYGTQTAGAAGELLMPYFTAYETLKFGEKYASLSAVEGMESSEAEILIVHSRDDDVVPVQYGYDHFFERFSQNERFEFILYENKGHGYLFCSDDALEYQAKLNAAYTEYIEGGDMEYNAENKEMFMRNHLDKVQCFEPDAELMMQILKLYDRCRSED